MSGMNLLIAELTATSFDDATSVAEMIPGAPPNLHVGLRENIIEPIDKT